MPNEWIDRVFAVCALTPQHTHMILTKRTERMREYLADDQVDARIDCEIDCMISERVDPLYRRSDDLRAIALCVNYEDGEPLPNVWLGTSVEDQTRANDRIPHLLATPAAKRFLSCEPLLGPVNLRRIRVAPDHHTMIDALDGYAMTDTPGRERERAMVDWVIVGGESGPGARPMHPDWARSLRDQCVAAGVSFFFKQWGEYHPHDSDVGLYKGPPRSNCRTEFVGEGDRSRLMIAVGKKAAGRLLDGVEHSEFPA